VKLDLDFSQTFPYDVSLIFFCRFLSPLSAVPLVSLVGFGLYELGFPGVSLLLHIYTGHVQHWSTRMSTLID
jgi:hypothetical protein